MTCSVFLINTEYAIQIEHPYKAFEAWSSYLSSTWMDFWSMLQMIIYNQQQTENWWMIMQKLKLHEILRLIDKTNLKIK